MKKRGFFVWAQVGCVALWLVLVGMLCITDVWDGTNGLLAFQVPGQSAGELVRVVLKTPLPCWRPIPSPDRRVHHPLDPV